MKLLVCLVVVPLGIFTSPKASSQDCDSIIYAARDQTNISTEDEFEQRVIDWLQKEENMNQAKKLAASGKHGAVAGSWSSEKTMSFQKSLNHFTDNTMRSAAKMAYMQSTGLGLITSAWTDCMQGKIRVHFREQADMEQSIVTIDLGNVKTVPFTISDVQSMGCEIVGGKQQILGKLVPRGEALIVTVKKHPGKVPHMAIVTEHGASLVSLKPWKMESEVSAEPVSRQYVLFEELEDLRIPLKLHQGTLRNSRELAERNETATDTRPLHIQSSLALDVRSLPNGGFEVIMTGNLLYEQNPDIKKGQFWAYGSFPDDPKIGIRSWRFSKARSLQLNVPQGDAGLAKLDCVRGEYNETFDEMFHPVTGEKLVRAWRSNPKGLSHIAVMKKIFVTVEPPEAAKPD